MIHLERLSGCFSCLVSELTCLSGQQVTALFSKVMQCQSLLNHLHVFET